MRTLIYGTNRINFAADLDDLMFSQVGQDESESWEDQLYYSRGVINVTPGELASCAS
jgi:hypothetical protein